MSATNGAGRVEGHISIEASEWYVDVDEPWPKGDRMNLEVKPHGDDFFTPHFSIGVMGSRSELVAFGEQVIERAKSERA